MRRGKVIGALVLLAAIGLIVAFRPDTPDPAGTSGPTATADTRLLAQATGQPAGPGGPGGAAARVFRVDAGQSEVYWRIYKAGAAARFGHNHVVSVTGLSGTVTLASELSASEWTLRFPVAGLVVDDQEIRARYGEEFSSVPSDGDKEGTKRNMLTPEVLDGAAHPEIRLGGRGVSGTLENAELPVSIEILGRVVERRLPARIVVGADSLTVSGEFRLTHTDLGMTPFTALGGLMSVGEDIDFSYRIHAVAGTP
jgi:hypothetical protein